MINFDGMIVGGYSTFSRRQEVCIRYLYNIYIEAPPSPLFLPIQLASLHGSSWIRELRNE